MSETARDFQPAERRAYRRQLGASIVALIIVAGIDYITSYELQFSVFYSIPIAILAWSGRSTPSLCFAVLCAFVWYIVDITTGQPYSSMFYLYWNTLLRLAAFTMLATAVIRIRRHVDREKELSIQLQRALEREVKDLEELLPICSTCKRIRDEKGRWTEIESYVRERAKIIFSHTICPECVSERYPEYSIERP